MRSNAQFKLRWYKHDHHRDYGSRGYRNLSITSHLRNVSFCAYYAHINRGWYTKLKLDLPPPTIERRDKRDNILRGRARGAA